MRNAACLACLGAFLGLSAVSTAQEKTWVLCDEADPAQRDLCVDDDLEVVFPDNADPATDSILEYPTFEKGREIEAMVVTDTKSSQVQGWAYGVAHDTRYLEILSAATDGTDADICPGIFDATTIDVATCGVDPGCSFENRTPGGGFVSAVTYFCGIPIHLPVKRNVVVRARYKMKDDAGLEGTLLHFSDRLAERRSPPVPLTLTVGGHSKLWKTVTDGWIRSAEGAQTAEFLRGDSNDDGKVDLSDPIWTIRQVAYGEEPTVCRSAADSNDDGSLDLSDAIYSIRWLLLGGPGIPAPFPACGVDPTRDSLVCSPGAAISCR